MKKLLFLTIIFLSMAHAGKSQTNLTDSLVNKLSTIENNDTAYVDLANEIATRYSLEDPRKSAYYTNIARNAAQRQGYKRGLIRSLIILGNNHLNVGLPDRALSYYIKALQSNAENFPLDYVRLHNNIGEAYRRKGIYDSSKRYFSKALYLARENIPDQKPVIIYSNLGEVSLMLKRVDESREYFKKCLENALESNHLVGIGYGYYGLAECYSLEENYDSALIYQQKSIQIRKQSAHQRGLIQSYLQQGHYYYQLMADSSLFYWELAAQTARSNDAYDLLSKSFENLYKYYLHTGEINLAADLLNKNKSIIDSLSTLEIKSRIEQLEGSLDAESLFFENQLLREQQRQIRDNARLQLLLLAIVAIVAVGFVVYYYKNQRKGKEIQSFKKENELSETLLEISGMLNEANFDLDNFLNQLLASSRIVLKCDRATYWEYIGDTIVLKNIDEERQHEKVPQRNFDLTEYQVMEDLVSRSNAIDDLSKSERFSNIYEEYFKPAGIKSLLNSSILIDGEFYGFISISVRNNVIRKWDTLDQQFIGSLKDLIKIAVTKNKAIRLQADKDYLLERVQLKNKSLREFNSVISHNLREPLTQIMGFNDLLKDVNNEDDTKNYLEYVSRATNKIDSVIKELSTVLNEEDPLASKYQEVSIKNVIEEVKQLLISEQRSRKIQFQFDLKPDSLISYKPFLIDVFYHLLSNSLKYSEKREELEINIKMASIEGGILVNFSDNGWGMNLDNFGDKVFKMYQRYHLNVEGRGIGLFIVNNRITSLGGTIEVDSEEEKGTTFNILLPQNHN